MAASQFAAQCGISGHKGEARKTEADVDEVNHGFRSFRWMSKTWQPMNKVSIGNLAFAHKDGIKIGKACCW